MARFQYDLWQCDLWLNVSDIVIRLKRRPRGPGADGIWMIAKVSSFSIQTFVRIHHVQLNLFSHIRYICPPCIIQLLKTKLLLFWGFRFYITVIWQQNIPLFLHTSKKRVSELPNYHHYLEFSPKSWERMWKVWSVDCHAELTLSFRPNFCQLLLEYCMNT